MKNITFLFLFLCTFKYSYSQEYQPSPKGELVKQTYYSLDYIERYEQPAWVYYKLTSEMVFSGTEDRTDDFRPDPSVSSGSAQLSDYKGTGYDRGHLCPAGDMKFSAQAMSETFYMSNMSPQVPSFNRGIWKNLESTVRQWAIDYKLIYIVTGPIFQSNLGAIGANNVIVPGYYYKVIYSPSTSQMIAFVLPNTKGERQITDYAITVDSLESITKIDFYPQLPDSIEKTLESKINLNIWSFTSNSNHSSGIHKKESSAAQCSGIAKSTGVRCKNQTTNANGYCSVHQFQSPDYTPPPNEGYSGQCQAITKKGTQCKRQASGGTKYCFQHQNSN